MDIKALVRQKRSVNNFLQAEEIVEFREINKLTQKDAGLLLGGGIRAFYKYEKEKQCQGKSTDILMKLLLQKKITIDDIKSVNKKE